ncbi:MAG TPA: hypothetical protein VNB49_00690, partial [Candidatus Dormibacteraeota bacterium]|nr:hypothetical protein [Candidatus Dormibacteraeota bacterium]
MASLTLAGCLPVCENLFILSCAMIRDAPSLLAFGAQLATLLLAAPGATNLFSQQSAPPPAPAATPSSSSLPQPKNWTAEEDHQNMMDQLG